MEFNVQSEIPYINLAVPVLYKLNFYKPTYENIYVPMHDNRLFKLRNGAEDELTQIDSINNKLATSKEKEDLSHVKSSSFKIKDVKSFRASTSLENVLSQIIDLKPAKQLVEPLDNNPLHIFVFITSIFIINFILF